MKGSHNVVTDALSCLDLELKLASQCNDTRLDTPPTRPLAETFGYDKQDIANAACPVMYKLIMCEQQKDKTLMKCTQSSMDIILGSFHGSGKSCQLLCENSKIIIPKNLQKKVTEWYHKVLCHPRETRIELTINQHLTWKGLCKTVHKVCSRCRHMSKDQKNKEEIWTSTS